MRTSRSFEEFYAAHFGPLTVQLYAHVGNLGEAEELVQEAFSRAWSRWERIEAYDDPVAWVRRVAWNLAITRWRRFVAARALARGQRPEPVRGPEPDRVAIIKAVATSPQSQRRAVVLYYLAGLTVSEIAADCGVADGTVKSWLYRARAALAQQLYTSESEVLR